jgi:hypothetical protein
MLKGDLLALFFMESKPLTKLSVFAGCQVQAQEVWYEMLKRLTRTQFNI